MIPPQTAPAEVGQGLHDREDAATWRVPVQVHRGRPVALRPRPASCLRRDAEREQRAGGAGEGNEERPDLSKGISEVFFFFGVFRVFLFSILGVFPGLFKGF